MTASATDETTARAGALSKAQMQAATARAPTYHLHEAAPAASHAQTVNHLWGGTLSPLLAARDVQGRFGGAPLACPPTACTGMLNLQAGARAKPWRNPDAIENLFCYEGRIEVRYGPELEHALTLDRYDMASVPPDVRHSITNVGPTEARLLVVLSVEPGGSYDAVFHSEDAVDAQSAGYSDLGVRFDREKGAVVAADALASRVTRFATLVPYKKDLNRSGGLPPEATEALSAGSVFTLIVPEGHVGRSRTAPIYGFQGLYMSIAECRTGDDAPPAHAHSDTQESFFILDGHFEVYTGFENESAISLGPGDVIGIPKQVMRTFRNMSGRPARLLAIIQGPDRMKDGVSYSRRVGAEFERRFGAATIDAYRKIGMTFDAEERLGQ